MNCYGVEVGTSLRFWENKGWINEIDPYGWFQWYFRYWKGERSEDDQRQINRRKRIFSRLVGILNKGKVKDKGRDIGKSKDSRSKDSLKIRQILLHWGYELK